ncbi:MAG TPA: MerR family transcriptional regulator [Actinocrinis sp.]|jgi:DNA-binding transcriptional MerR regulator
MRISQLAEASGVPASTLRFYDSAGLLPAQRADSGYRLYRQDALERLAFIGAAKRFGLALEEIAELLGVWEHGACSEVKASLRPKVAARQAEAERRAAEVAGFAASLSGALERIDALPDRPGRCDEECGIASPGPVSTEPVSPERWRAAPIACSLDGADLEQRAADWRGLLDGAAPARIPDGVRFDLPAERAAALAALAAAEQHCCPFFDFRLHLDGPLVHFEVRAPAEAAELVDQLSATVFRGSPA